MRRMLVVMGVFGIAISLLCLTQLFAGRTLSDDAIARLYGGECGGGGGGGPEKCFPCTMPEIVICDAGVPACQGKQAGEVCSGPQIMLSRVYMGGWCRASEPPPDECNPGGEASKCLREVWVWCLCETLGEFLVCDDAEVYLRVWCANPDDDCTNPDAPCEY